MVEVVLFLVIVFSFKLILEYENIPYVMLSIESLVFSIFLIFSFFFYIFCNFFSLFISVSMMVSLMGAIKCSLMIFSISYFGKTEESNSVVMM